MFEIKVPTLSEAVVEKIREMIKTGIIRPGEKINVDDLARQFQVSPTPIREALAKLEKEGLAARMPRLGWQVAKLSRSDFIYLHDFQKILELAICERLLAQKKKIDFETAYRINETMAFYVKTEQFNRILEENEKFHLSIYNICTNHILLETLKNTWNTLQWQRRIMITSKEYLNRYYDEHLEILKSLEKEDLESLKSAIEQHFLTGQLALKESFKDEE